MKIHRLLISVAIEGILAAGCSAAQDSNDHLAPIHRDWDSQYRELLTAKLSITPFNYGRVLIKPPFAGESSISIYCERRSNGGRCYVTYLVARRSLWQETDGGHMPEKAASVKVRRADFEIPNTTAATVKEAFSRMLVKTRGHPHSEERALPIDATSIEFALQREAHQQLTGQVNPFLPRQGNKVRELLELAHQLESYCRAEQNGRPSIAINIEQEARQLASGTGR